MAFSNTRTALAHSISYEMTLRYGLPHYAGHNALIDAIATAELLQAQVQHHFGTDTPIGDLWV